MATREEFLKQIWQGINAPMEEHWIANSIRVFERHPDDPFADTGEALKRLLALGASPRDLSLLQRDASYQTAFSLLYALSDPGIDGNDVGMLHELLLTADPSGLDGCPGSAPTKSSQ
jgi:hypothetical protein